MVQVEGLAVEVTRGFANFEEFLDFRVVDVEIAGSRTTAQRALADREGQRVHHADERNDAGSLSVLADFLADGADMAPIGADAAAIRGEPDILGPGLDNVVKRVANLIQEAGNRQAAICAAIRENWRGRHEPEIRHVVIDALGVILVVGKGFRDTGEHALIGFTRQEIAILKRLLAELGEVGIARRVDLDFPIGDKLQVRLHLPLRLAPAKGGFRSGGSIARRHVKTSQTAQ